MIILCRKCEAMSVQSIQITEPSKNNFGRVATTGAIGAALGAGARYVVPTKAEASSIFNKEAVDTFVSSASAQARGANRSILKYAGAGGAIAIILGALSKLFPKHNEKNDEYSKYAALLDAPDYAVEVMWYGE